MCGGRKFTDNRKSSYNIISDGGVYIIRKQHYNYKYTLLYIEVSGFYVCVIMLECVLEKVGRTPPSHNVYYIERYTHVLCILCTYIEHTTTT